MLTKFKHLTLHTAANSYRSPCKEAQRGILCTARADPRFPKQGSSGQKRATWALWLATTLIQKPNPYK